MIPYSLKKLPQRLRNSNEKIKLVLMIATIEEEEGELVGERKKRAKDEELP